LLDEFAPSTVKTFIKKDFSEKMKKSLAKIPF